MQEFFADHPGRWFVLATLLPLSGAVVLLLSGAINRLTRPTTKPSKLPGYFAVGVMLVTTIIVVQQSTLMYMNPPAVTALQSERLEWIKFGSLADPSPFPERMNTPNRWITSIHLGYHVDWLAALLLSMVCFITTLVMVFSLAYMDDETQSLVEDHSAHTKRQGRFGQFFLYLLLFAFSMIFLMISDNLLQIFFAWEFVGVSSYFLIGFYTERKSATTASLKAFLMNRIGDAGFLMGLFFAWTLLELGTSKTSIT